jgi:hypothetical protein
VWLVNSRPKCSSRVETTGPAGTDETRIAQANVARFKLLLETDPTKRAMLTKVLAEEEAKQTHTVAKLAEELN